MGKLRVAILMLLAISAGLPSFAFAGPFRRYSRRASYSSTTTTTTASRTTAIPVSSSQTATAQGVAQLMAQYGRVGHFGGNPGYEGCGSGGSPQAAYNNCCYANSGMATVDVGYAQGSNGMWYCCRRYN